MDKIEWIVIEALAVLIENFMFLYFLNNRFESKYDDHRPLIVTWCALVCWGLAATFLGFPLYDFVSFLIMLLYLLASKKGKVLHKIIGDLMVWAIMLGTSLAGASLASALTSSSIHHTLVYQDTPRLLSIIMIKMIQIIAFYILSKKQKVFRDIKRGPTLVLGGAVILDFLSLIWIRIFIETSGITMELNNLLVALAIGSLLIMIAIFLMFELFIREEAANIDLAVRLQRLELESQFYKEIDAMYSDMRTWRHEYKNNLTVIRSFITNDEKEKVLQYLDTIASESSRNNITLQTGNLVLDAIVSSKLWLAQSHQIEVTMQAVYPENNRISDNDLCAIIGNLLDNAIEACERIHNMSVRKFINFVLLVKNQNLLISISNSYNNEVKYEGERYLTTKKGRFHGIGISYVDDIVKKYDGHVQRSLKPGIFDTQVMLPLIAPEGGEQYV